MSVRAAKLAVEVGFDFVDVKQCHRYLLNELLGARKARHRQFCLGQRQRGQIGIVAHVGDDAGDDGGLPRLVLADRGVLGQHMGHLVAQHRRQFRGVAGERNQAAGDVNVAAGHRKGVDDRLVDYINKIVRLTRQWPQFHMGASPRAGIALMQAARTLAAFSGRDYAVPDDVFQIALPALRHRVILTAEAEVEGHRVDDLLMELIRSVEVPRL